MAWQPQGGRGGYNPNASSWTPQGQGQNPQAGGWQQQGGYGGGYNPAYGGAPYYPQQGGYPPQMGGYPQQGGYYYGQGGYPPQPAVYGGYGAQQNQPQGPPVGLGGDAPAQAQPAQAQAPTPAPATKSAKADPKLQLDLGGGSKKKDLGFVMPAQRKACSISAGGGKSLTIGGDKPAEKPVESPTAPAPAPASTSPAPAEEKPQSPTTDKPQSPVAPTEPATTSAPTTTEEKKAEAPVAGKSKEVVEAPKPKPKQQRPKKEYVRDPRPHFNVVFCGHVDAGKSTISGRLLADSGLVDEREMQKLKADAVKYHREGWEFAYVMDVSEEERERGKTHEVGAAYFETKARRITILDAPGHKAFVPSMIGGAAQAEICVLVISARTGEFETGFELGGQTREHIMLVRACGVKHLICCINKMDDCEWSKDRYEEIQGKMRPFLRQNGFDEKQKNIMWMPISGLTGMNIFNRLTDCPWYGGVSLVEYLDNLALPQARTEDDELCVPVAGAYKDDGKVFIYGKVESGSIVVGDKLLLLPSKTEVVVEGVAVEATPIEKAYPGDNVHIRVKGVEDTEVHPGYVLTMEPTPFRAVDYFKAKIVVLEVKNLLSNGSRCMMNLGVAEVEVSIHKILAKLDPKTHEPIQKEPSHIKAREAFIARIELAQSTVVEDYLKFDKLGRFMLREDGKTIAIGVILQLYDSTKEQVVAGTAPKKSA